MIKFTYSLMHFNPFFHFFQINLPYFLIYLVNISSNLILVLYFLYLINSNLTFFYAGYLSNLPLVHLN